MKTFNQQHNVVTYLYSEYLIKLKLSLKKYEIFHLNIHNNLLKLFNYKLDVCRYNAMNTNKACITLKRWHIS